MFRVGHCTVLLVSGIDLTVEESSLTEMQIQLQILSR